MYRLRLFYVARVFLRPFGRRGGARPRCSTGKVPSAPGANVHVLM